MAVSRIATEGDTVTWRHQGVEVPDRAIVCGNIKMFEDVSCGFEFLGVPLLKSRPMFAKETLIPNRPK